MLSYNSQRFHKGDYFSGYLAAKQGLTIPLSDDAILVERWIYEYGTLLEFSICAYWIGKHDAQLVSYLLLGKDIPSYIRECVNKNMAFIDAKIAPKCVLVGADKNVSMVAKEVGK